MTNGDDRCTAKGCRTRIRDGRGNQFVAPDGEIERFCDRCWEEFCAEVEEKPGAASIAFGLMVGLGIVLLVMKGLISI